MTTAPVRLLLGLALVACLLGGLADGAAANPITAENALTGDGHWLSYEHLAPASTIQGYSSESSVAPGGTLHLHVDSPASSYRVEVDRLGWYGGEGGRRVACVPGCSGSEAPVSQSNPPIVDETSGRLDANWTVTDTVPIGTGWASGYYVAEFVVTSGPDAGDVAWYPFVVTPPAGNESTILVQVPINTWQAYNPWPGGAGGRSLYNSNSGEKGAATKVSFNRPLTIRPENTSSSYYQEPVFGREVQAVRFLEREGYDVSYVTDADVDREPDILLKHRVDMVLGHDEYWTAAMRDGWDAALAAGHNEIFMGGDIGTWMVRYEDGGRTLVGYKGHHDPVTPPTKKFRDQIPPEPECELEGVQYDDHTSHGGQGDYIVTTAAASNPWIQAAGLKPGDSIHAAVGYEWDAVTPGCATPPLQVLFQLPSAGKEGEADAVTFTAVSGGRVFSSGSNMFANMLDSYNDSSSSGQVADPRIQAFTNALLADFSRPSSSSSGCSLSNIKGAGSSLQGIAHAKVWAPAFEGPCPGLEIKYESTGSAAGMSAWNFDGAKGSIDTGLSFIGTDDAPSAAQIANIKSKAGGAQLAVIPVAQTSIAILANPPAGCEVELITNANLAGVFEGRLSKWSQLEGAEGACNSPITRVVRKDGSGTTYQLKNYLFQLYKKGLFCTTGGTEGKKSWQELEPIGSGAHPNVDWPESCTEKALSAIVRPAGNGGGEEVGKVNSTAGSIGYAALSDAEAGISGTTTILALQNNGQKKGGEANFANAASGSTANCGGITYSGFKLNSGLDIDWSGIFGAKPTVGGKSYPLCTLTYDLALHGYKAAGFSEAQEITTAGYLGYVLQPAAQEAIAGNFYSSLPSSAESKFDVLGAARKAAKAIGY